MRHKNIYMENHYTKCGDKKTVGSMTSNLNPLYETML